MKTTHSKESFAFTVQAPIAEAAPLFGAYKERAWAPDFNPQFIHPHPARDTQGMVFTVSYGKSTAYWVNTEFDLKNGCLRYSYVIPQIMATALYIRLAPEGENTHVDVTYERTALSTEGNEQVARFSAGDRTAGPEWQEQINAYLEGLKARNIAG